MIEVKGECRGISPYLMNPMTEDTLEELRTKVRRPKPRDLTREQEAAGKVTRDEKGRIGIPMKNFFSCLVNAGRAFKMDARTKISTTDSTLLPSLLSVKENFLPFLNGTEDSEPQWVADAQRGRNPVGQERVAVCIVRPRFDEWGFRFTAFVDEKKITLEQAKQLVEYAGTAIGLGDYSPRCKGPYGRFTVTKWEPKGKAA